MAVPVTTLTAEFAMPAIGANGVAQVADLGFFAVGNFAYVEGLGYFETEAVNGRAITLINRGFIENASAGVTAPVGARTNSSGPIGPEGRPPFSKLAQAFTMPALNATGNAVVEDATYYAVGMGVYIAPIGYLVVDAVLPGADTLTITPALGMLRGVPLPGEPALVKLSQ